MASFSQITNARTVSLVVGALLCSTAYAKDKWPSDEGVVRAELGTAEPWKPLSFEVPNPTTAMVVSCGGFDGLAVGGSFAVSDPQGLRWSPPAVTAYRADLLDEVIAAQLPGKAGDPLASGQWTVTWQAPADDAPAVRCHAVFRTDPPADVAVVGLHMVLVGVPGLDAKTAHRDKAVRTMTRELKRQLATAGIKPVIRWRDFAAFGGDTDTFTVLDLGTDDLSELDDLLGAAQLGDGRGVPVFWVQEISDHGRGAGPVLGLAAGAPGARGPDGSSRSAVVISAVDLLSAPDDVAAVLSHTLGVHLGLTDTTDKFGQRHDPIRDTASCDNDADEGGVLSTIECFDSGADNPMWWTVSTTNSGFSPEQGWLLRHSTAVR